MRTDLNYKRIEWIDLVRSLAIMCVCLCHALEYAYNLLSLDDMKSLTFLSRIFAFAISSIGRLGVPFFLILTGYLLLDREYDEKKIIDFWKHRWLHLLICTWIWFIIFSLLSTWLLGTQFRLLSFFKSLFFFDISNIDGKINHVWYLPMILGIYLLIPFVARALRNFRLKLLVFPFLIYFFYAFGYSFLNLLNTIINPENPIKNDYFSLGYSGGIYGLYIILGYLIKRGCLKKIPTHIVLLIAISSLVLTAGLLFWTNFVNIQYILWYSCPFLPVSASAFFEFCSRLKKIYWYSIVKIVSYYSFSIYLTHIIFLAIWGEKFVVLVGGARSVQTIMLWLISLCGGLICSWIISKMPGIGKYVLYLH